MQYLSYKSRLVELAASGKHYDVKVDPVSLHRLIAWVDACCPFMGEEELRPWATPISPGSSDCRSAPAWPPPRSSSGREGLSTR